MSAPAAPSAAKSAAWIGPAAAVLGVLGFSFKAILIKLAYAASPIDALTLLALRMMYSAPLFVAMAWWAGRRPGTPPFTRHDGWMLASLGFVGYYFSSLLDFIGLQYISASFERLVLFLNPTFVVALSAIFLKKPVTARIGVALVVSYAGIALCLWQDVRVSGDVRATAIGSAFVFVSAISYATYLVFSTATIVRLGSLRFTAWAMLASTVFVIATFLAVRPLSALDVGPRIHLLSAAMAVFSTVLPVWLITESIRRMGADIASLIGSLGPVFTIGLGAMLLGESIHAIQIFGAVLVMGGVLLVTAKPRR